MTDSDAEKMQAADLTIGVLTEMQASGKVPFLVGMPMQKILELAWRFVNEESCRTRRDIETAVGWETYARLIRAERERDITAANKARSTDPARDVAQAFNNRNINPNSK